MMDEEEEDGVLHPRVTWVAPESDIPLKDYQLSWWKTSPKFADAFERSHYVTFDRLESAKTDKRHAVASALRSNNADPVDPDEDYGLYTGVDGNAESHRNVIVPSYSTSAELDEVEPDEIYIVEV
jgi:hypothetical protein